MIKATYKKHNLKFRQASATSRGILKTKETFFIILQKNNKIGVGESAVFRGLSFDDVPNYEKKLQWACENINLGLFVLLGKLNNYPSIQFALEQAFLSLESNEKFILFPSKFTQSQDAISINGLIWMGSEKFMKKQIKEKLKTGFTSLKLKIGAIDFNTELNLLKSIRKEFTAKEITLRVDANGAFSPRKALEKLKYLSDFDLHSIEQPIKQNQWEEMAILCEKTPLPIALDEELIAVIDKEQKEKLLQTIKPQFIILKPSLIGGIKGSNQWINLAKNKNIDWWITSALESNIGLNAIAQYTYSLGTTLPQGLGTGSLFTNNIDSPLCIENGNLVYKNAALWNCKFLTNIDLLKKL
ncbi:MAG: o-succinylbenzoate synthase [Flavobacteriaceae bacterium]|nr:o-succinylbenzoate synthase [Flavobacteriaceae bacterium]